MSNVLGTKDKRSWFILDFSGKPMNVDKIAKTTESSITVFVIFVSEIIRNDI